jgi:membrane-bound serine protease (ClpP class)
LPFQAWSFQATEIPAAGVQDAEVLEAEVQAAAAQAQAAESGDAADAALARQGEQPEAAGPAARNVQRDPTWEDLLAQGPFRRPFLMRIHGAIDHTTLRYARAALRQAQTVEADLVVVEIDSPGGGAVESMEIADMLSQIQWGRTVAWIPREATSGGAMIALGCEHIVMHPGATLGDIGVIHLDPTVWAFRYAPAKVRSILVAKARALALRHNRSAELAEAMVDEYSVVYQQADDPQQFKLISLGAPEVLDQGAAKLPADLQVDEELPGGWQLVPETRRGRFLTLPHARAAALGFSQHTCESLEQLQAELPIDGPWVVRTYGFTDRVVDFLNNFWVTILLLVIGLIALFLEIASPGISVGGLLALLCFSLFFWSHFMGGTAGLLEVILFVTGVLCLIVELFVLPGFGVAGVMGVGLLALSLVMATLDFVYPADAVQWTRLGDSLLMIVAALLVGGLGIGLLINYMGSIPALNRLTLAPPRWDDPAPVAKKDAHTTAPALMVTEGRAAGIKVGDAGLTESVLRPAGRARIGGRSVDVVADGKYIEPGQPIKVVEVRGNRLIVVPLDPT